MREQTALPHTYTSVGRLWDGNKGNYDNNRANIDMIIIHTMAGTTKGSTAHFQNVATMASAHYGVSLDGSLTQWITENCVAYHAGAYPINQRSIGIEHEDGYNPQTKPNATNEPRPDALYETSARLVADISAFYKIPLDRDHIKMHREVSQKGTACPGTLDIDRIINRAKELVNPAPQEEQLVVHMIKPSVFKNMVTKATNWDDFCKLAGVSPEAAVQHEMGIQVYNVFENQLNEAKRVNSQPNNPPAVTTTGVPVESAVESVVSSNPPVALQETPTVESPTDQAKTIWQKDVLDVLKDILASVRGRVTL